MKIIGKFQELNGEEFGTIGELIEAKGLVGIGSISSDSGSGNVELYHDYTGATYAVVHDYAKPQVEEKTYSIVVEEDSDPVYCTCVNPNGFRFYEHKLDHQVWIHAKCGGQVIKPLIKSGRR